MGRGAGRPDEDAARGWRVTQRAPGPGMAGAGKRRRGQSRARSEQLGRRAVLSAADRPSWPRSEGRHLGATRLSGSANPAPPTARLPAGADRGTRQPARALRPQTPAPGSASPWAPDALQNQGPRCRPGPSPDPALTVCSASLPVHGSALSLASSASSTYSSVRASLPAPLPRPSAGCPCGVGALLSHAWGPGARGGAWSPEPSASGLLWVFPLTASSRAALGSFVFLL